MSLQIFESNRGVDPLCDFKMFAVNRELWPTFLQGASCRPCMSPLPGNPDTCCNNFFKVSWPGLPSLSSGGLCSSITVGPLTIYGSPSDRVIPAGTTFSFFPGDTAFARLYQNVNIISGEYASNYYGLLFLDNSPGSGSKSFSPFVSDANSFVFKDGRDGGCGDLLYYVGDYSDFRMSEIYSRNPITLLHSAYSQNALALIRLVVLWGTDPNTTGGSPFAFMNGLFSEVFCLYKTAYFTCGGATLFLEKTNASYGYYGAGFGGPPFTYLGTGYLTPSMADIIPSSIVVEGAWY